MNEYRKAQERLKQASYQFSQAQAAMEEAEVEFNEAKAALDALEGQPSWPSADDVSGTSQNRQARQT